MTVVGDGLGWVCSVWFSLRSKSDWKRKQRESGKMREGGSSHWIQDMEIGFTVRSKIFLIMLKFKGNSGYFGTLIVWLCGFNISFAKRNTILRHKREVTVRYPCYFPRTVDLKNPRCL
jgi:hypothetical protein